MEDLISLEVEELQKGVAAIQQELDATRATLAEVSSACTPPAHRTSESTGTAVALAVATS